jgi:anti-sigma factor RsiW
MTDHDDIRSLLGVYALDAIDDPDELRAVELHLTGCAECRAEVDAHRSVTSAMAEAELEAPPDLWERIEGELDVVPAQRSQRLWSLTSLTSIAAVAAIAAAVGMGALWSEANGDVADLQDRVSELEAAVVQAEAALAQADPVELAVERARETGAAFEVTVSGDIGSGTAIVLANGQGWLTDLTYAQLGPSETYQLWAIQDGIVISAGVLGSHPGTVSFHVDADKLDGLVITVERAGGVASSENPAAAAWLADA